MGLDIAAMRARQAAQKAAGATRKKSSLFTFPEGETVVFLCPPAGYMDGVPYAEYAEAWRVGAEGRGATSHRSDRNDLWHPITQEHLAKRGIELDRDLGCPLEKAWSGDWSEIGDEAPVGGIDGLQPWSRYLWTVIPVGRWNGPEIELFPKSESMPQLARVTQDAHDDLVSIVEREISQGRDPTDPANQILVCIKHEVKGGKKGKHFYSASVDRNPSLAADFRLSKAQQLALEKGQEKGGELDPFRVIAAFCLSREDLNARMRGASSASKEKDDRPSCWPTDWEPDFPACQKCPHAESCKEKTLAGSGGGVREAAAKAAEKAPTKDAEKAPVKSVEKKAEKKVERPKAAPPPPPPPEPEEEPEEEDLATPEEPEPDSEVEEPEEVEEPQKPAPVARKAPAGDSEATVANFAARLAAMRGKK